MGHWYKAFHSFVDLIRNMDKCILTVFVKVTQIKKIIMTFYKKAWQEYLLYIFKLSSPHSSLAKKIYAHEQFNATNERKTYFASMALLLNLDTFY